MPPTTVHRAKRQEVLVGTGLDAGEWFDIESLDIILYNSIAILTIFSEGKNMGVI